MTFFWGILCVALSLDSSLCLLFLDVESSDVRFALLTLFNVVMLPIRVSDNILNPLLKLPRSTANDLVSCSTDSLRLSMDVETFVLFLFYNHDSNQRTLELLMIAFNVVLFKATHFEWKYWQQAPSHLINSAFNIGSLQIVHLDAIRSVDPIFVMY